MLLFFCSKALEYSQNRFQADEQTNKCMKFMKHSASVSHSAASFFLHDMTYSAAKCRHAVLVSSPQWRMKSN